MTISPIGNSYDNFYGTGRTSAGYGAADSAPSMKITEDAGKTGIEPLSGKKRTEDGTEKSGKAQLSGKERDDWKKKTGIEDPSEECQTCKNRKYKDGSDEGDVSFKAAAHIDPKSAAARVRSHEQEHVSNAYQKAEKNNGKVVACNVSIHTAVCSECGRTYVSGGTTATQIKYRNEDNPYQKDMKSSDAVNKYRGMNYDEAV